MTRDAMRVKDDARSVASGPHQMKLTARAKANSADVRSPERLSLKAMTRRGCRDD